MPQSMLSAIFWRQIPYIDRAYLYGLASLVFLMSMLAGTPSWSAQSSAISAGQNHSVALRSDGLAYSWGSNAYGQLGAGGSIKTFETAPEPVWGSLDAVSVAAGDDHVIAIRADGTLHAWGRNEHGQLGDGTQQDQTIPVPITMSLAVTQVAAGGAHSAALAADGSVWAWGLNSSGQLGDNTRDNQLVPKRVPALGTVAAVAAGAAHTLILSADGTVYGWGSNEFGQLGNGDRQTTSVSPVQAYGLSHVVAIAAGLHHSLALQADGSVWAWGNFAGSVQLMPKKVQGLGSIIALASGADFALALNSSGAVWAWGGNSSGQLGDGSTQSRSIPARIEELSGIVAIAAGFAHSMAMSADGTLFTWGRNTGGQLGRGDTVDRHDVAEVAGWEIPVVPKKLRAGYDHAVLLLSNGSVLAWGDNHLGQLGSEGGTGEPVWVPSAINLKDSAAGEAFSIGLAADGRVWSWGSIDAISPASAVSLTTLTDVVTIAAGARHALALGSDGQVWAWGNNQAGQVGANAGPTATPVLVPELTNVVAIAAGDNHNLALKSDGSVWSWGSNDSGQLGALEISDRDIPAQVSGLDRIVLVAAGHGHNLALRADGTLWAWGLNNRGQLGDGSTTNRFAPYKIGNLGQVVQVAAGAGHSLALLGNGNIMAWGDNRVGQIGDGSLLPRLTPVKVVALEGVTGLTAGRNFSLASMADETLRAWGSNQYGAIGGAFDLRNVPTLVSGLDVRPYPFAFTSRNGATVGAFTTSAPEQVTGIDGLAQWRTLAGLACVGTSANNCGCADSGFTDAGTVHPGDYICVRHTSGQSFGSMAETSLIIGGVTGSFTSTTTNVPVGDSQLSQGLWIIDQENNGQPGRGFQIDVQHTIMALTFFGYQADGAPYWLLASGPMAGTRFDGSLETYAGGNALGAPHKPAVAAGSAGRVSLTFTSPTSGMLLLPGELPKSISKLAWGTRNAVQPDSGLWVIDDELDGNPGRGFQVDAQGDVIALTFYGYSASGNPIWYLASGPMLNSRFAGELELYTDGMAFGDVPGPARLVGSAGTVVLRFDSQETGTLELPGEPAKAVSKLRW